MEPSKVKRLQEFISELDEISYKYDIRIWGCGCCGSPRLVDTVTNETLAEDICWRDGYSYNLYPSNAIIYLAASKKEEE